MTKQEAQDKFNADMVKLLKVTPYPRMDAAFFRMKGRMAGFDVSIIDNTLADLAEAGGG